MTINKTYLAKIHIAKKELGLGDDSYRDIMARVCNAKTSAKELNTNEADLLLTEFKRLGWKPKTKKQHKKKADNRQVRYIYALWNLLKKQGAVYAETPHAFCEVMLKQRGDKNPPSHVEWIKDQNDLNHLIEILKDKCSTAGIELDD